MKSERAGTRRVTSVLPVAGPSLPNALNVRAPPPRYGARPGPSRPLESACPTRPARQGTCGRHRRCSLAPSVDASAADKCCEYEGEALCSRFIGRETHEGLLSSIDFLVQASLARASSRPPIYARSSSLGSARASLNEMARRASSVKALAVRGAGLPAAGTSASGRPRRLLAGGRWPPLARSVRDVGCEAGARRHQPRPWPRETQVWPQLTCRSWALCIQAAVGLRGFTSCSW